MPNRLTAPSLAFALAMALAGCKILPTPAEGEALGAVAAFNPEARVDEIWSERVLPYLDTKAGPVAEVVAAAAADPAAAGARFGNPNKQASAPWTYAVRVDGKVVGSNLDSRAATVDVDVDGDGQADARVQIGPAYRGTALRDSLDFVNFNEFTNQIEFAQFGKAFNTHADQQGLSALPREGLEGRTIAVVGAYTAGPAGELPLVMPAHAEYGPNP